MWYFLFTLLIYDFRLHLWELRRGDSWDAVNTMVYFYHTSTLYMAYYCTCFREHRLQIHILSNVGVKFKTLNLVRYTESF